jgi:hypothetical protein
MKLEIKHLAPYLPYNLKFKEINYGGTYLLCGIIEDELWFKDNYGDNFNSIISDESMKPILRPLSDLTKEIEVNGERFVPNYWFGRSLHLQSILDEKFHIVQKLIQWHFDVFGLIEENLAIDINTLNK